MARCHSCLKETSGSFCNPCLKKLFGGKKVGHILPFTRDMFNEIRLAHSDRLSISGVQIKYSLRLEANQLHLTEEGGRFIIKPVPYGPFKLMDFIPSNEHLTMQIAGQVFKINTPPSALMFFKNEEPAYLVKRFDVLDDGNKVLQEDFAQVSNRTEENSGINYKYDYSYEEITELMKKYLGAYPIEIEKFFSQILFNYLICNGDAHLKNFSTFRNEKFGDYILTPAYDLLNTKIHVGNEADTALELFKDKFMTESFKAGSKYTRDDFMVFGMRVGIKEERIKNIITNFTSHEKIIEQLVQKSFLNDELKANYIECINMRRDRLLH